jgi:hypothetical protein
MELNLTTLPAFLQRVADPSGGDDFPLRVADLFHNAR